MWLVIIPFVVALGVVPVIWHHRNKRASEHAYASVSKDDNDVELAQCYTQVCDVIEWLTDARERIGMVDEPVVNRINTGGGVPATRISFGLTSGQREIWLDGPVFMEPLPRIRHVDWKVSDVGIAFARSAEGVEQAVLQTNARRE